MTAEVALLLVGLLLVQVLLIGYVLPGVLADRARWSEPVEPLDLGSEDQSLVSAARRRS